MSKIFWGGLIAVFSIHVLAVMHSWYFFYAWIDIPMHFFGGILSAIGVYLLLTWKPHWFSIAEGNVLTPMLLMLGGAALIGIGWEFFEFSYDVIAKPETIRAIAQPGVRDTIGDLFFDLLGALVTASVFFTFRIRS